MDLSCERCRTRKFKVTLGAHCAYIICLRCGQEFGTVAEALPGRPAVELAPEVPDAN